MGKLFKSLLFWNQSANLKQTWHGLSLGCIFSKLCPVTTTSIQDGCHVLILNILFFNKLRQIIPDVRSEMRDLLIFIFILKTTGTFTPVHSAGYLILRNEFRSTQEIARQNIQVSIYIRSTGLWPNAWIHVSQSLAIIRNAEYTFCDLLTNP